MLGQGTTVFCFIFLIKSENIFYNSDIIPVIIQVQIISHIIPVQQKSKYSFRNICVEVWGPIIKREASQLGVNLNDSTVVRFC